MSNYKPLYDSIWSDVDFQEYTISKKLLYIYLTTNKFTEKSGIYKITVRQMSFDTGIEKDLINDLINEFINDGKLKYDAKNGIIFVKNIYKFHKGLIKNKNILLLTLKRSYELINTDFWQDLFALYPNDETLKIFINEVINGSLMAHQLYINTSKNKGKSSNKSKAADNHNEEFEKFWTLYNHKKSKALAVKSFEKALKVDSFDNILYGLSQYVKFRGKESQFWKHPSTWLNQECWNDDYTSSQEKSKQIHNNFGDQDFNHKIEGFEYD